MARSFFKRKPRTNADFGLLIALGLIAFEGVKALVNKAKTSLPIPGMTSIHTVVDKTEVKQNPDQQQ